MKLRIAKKSILFAKSHRDVTKAFTVLNKHLKFKSWSYERYKDKLDSSLFFVLTERGWHFVIQEKGILYDAKSGLSLKSTRYKPYIIRMVDMLDTHNIPKMGWRLDSDGNVCFGKNQRYGSMWTVKAMEE